MPFNQFDPDFILLDVLARGAITTVLDVGANRGQFAEWLFAYGFKGEVHSFEPLPEAYAALESAARAHRRWAAHALALGSTNGQSQLYVGRNDQTSSLNAVDRAAASGIEALDVVGCVSVPVQRLDSWLEVHRIDPARTILKIDVQGSEQDVLEGAGAALDKFQLIQVETAIVPVYRGESRLPVLIDFFHRRSFVVRGLRPVYFHPKTRELMQVDLLVERGPHC